MSGAAVVLRLALDQNFPTPFIEAVRQFLPSDVELAALQRIDHRLTRLDDRQLLLVLYHLGWHGLVTNNYKMLNVPGELAAIIRTQAVIVAFEGLGDDPLRAAGALLLELPGLAKGVVPRRSNVFRISYRRRSPQNARELFADVARRRKEAEATLWEQALITEAEYEAARAMASS